MSTPAWLAHEPQLSTTPESQGLESPVGGPATGPPTSVMASTTVVSPVGGPATTAITPVTSLPTTDSGPPLTVTVSTTASVGPPPPRGVIVNANTPSQDPVRAKFATSQGFVIPAPPFSYSVFPRMNSASGSTQQSSSTPGLRLTPPMPATALQPPVPGQFLGNKPSFSYNVVSNANASLATGQQFQLTTAANQANLQGGRFAPPTTAASLQPPVPGQSVRPAANVPGAITPSCPAPMRLPLSIPTGTSDAVVIEAGTTITTSVDSQSAKLSATVSLSSSVASGINPNANSSGILMPSTPSFTGHPGMPGLAGTPGLPGIPNSATVSSTVTSQPTTTNSSPLRPMVPSPVSLPPTSTPVPVQQNIQQQFYPPYPSLPGTIPAPQSLWLHPSQAGGLQQAPFLPYSGILPAPFHFPMHGMPPPAIPVPSIQPPGVSTVANQGPTSTTIGSSQSGSNVVIESPSLGIDHENHANDPHKDGESTKNEEADAWTAHKTESGVVYYYNSVTGESTYEKPSSFKGEVFAQRTCYINSQRMLQLSQLQFHGRSWLVPIGR